jgi:eukaryotic-like serine/threonine-protein kinase
MAEIYRARTFDSYGAAVTVAVKRVLAHLAEDDDFIQMLVDEAKIASVLRHNNIARVYEFARAGQEYFIAMEFVDGKDMRTALERCRVQKVSIPPQHASYICAEIASGLHAAHSAVDSQHHPLRIIHRDVSPSNIIVSYAGEAKLCDFGIAKATLSRVQTRTGVIKGKVKYMSPEQALGRKLDHRSDIFSLGASMYEMLTRLPPFVASNEMDLLIKVRDAKYRPIRELEPSVPAELASICDRCLTRSRANRYQTAAEVEADLRQFLARYAPDYSRSHLGRYVRKMFASEIDKELRMLEEYVVDEIISDDVGENLIGSSNKAEPDAVPFQPKPTIPLRPPTGSEFSGDSSFTTAPSAPPVIIRVAADVHAEKTLLIDDDVRRARMAAGAAAAEGTDQNAVMLTNPAASTLVLPVVPSPDSDQPPPTVHEVQTNIINLGRDKNRRK